MKRGRLIKAGLLLIAGIVLVVAAGLFLVNSIINKKIRSEFSNLSPALQVKFSRIRSSLFSSSISFDSLQVSFSPYPSQSYKRHLFTFTKASLSGIQFLNFVVHKKLVANDLVLDEGNMQLDQSLLNPEDSVQMYVLQQIKWPFKNVRIKNIRAKQCNFILHSENGSYPLAKGDVAVNGLAVDVAANHPVISGVNLRLSDIDYPFSNYRVGIKQLELNSAREQLTVDSLRVHSRNGDQSLLNIPSMKITGLGVMKLLNNGMLYAQKIVIEGGDITMSDEKLKAQPPSFHLKSIHADVFHLVNSSVSYQDNEGSCRFAANIEVHKLNIDQPFHKNDFHFASAQVSLSGIHYLASNYRGVDIRKVEIDSKKETILARDINILPTIGKYQLGRKLGHQVDWMAANISKIDISKANVNELFHRKLIAEKIVIGPSKAYIFRDRRLPRQQKALPLPVENLNSIPLDIRVKTLVLGNATVEYEEYPRAGFGQTGILKIKNAKVVLSPLINHPASSDPTYMTMKAFASIMGSGTAHGTILMPLAKNKPYLMKGAIERLELTMLNSSSENLGKIRIKSGFLDYLSFDFVMTDQRSTGKIVGAYHHLIIQQLKKHTDEKNVADFASFMLRHLIIPLNKDASLPEQKRTGMVNYVRDPTRVVSYYFLQSLLMGVKKSFTLGFLLPK